MISFLTGSQIYRKSAVTKDTDIDLVIHVDEATKQALIELSDLGKMPCKFGKLNLIFAVSPVEWATWLSAKVRCEKEAKDASREIHYGIHEEQRQLFGTTYDHDSKEENE